MNRNQQNTRQSLCAGQRLVQCLRGLPDLRGFLLCSSAFLRVQNLRGAMPPGFGEKPRRSGPDEGKQEQEQLPLTFPPFVL